MDPPANHPPPGAGKLATRPPRVWEPSYQATVPRRWTLFMLLMLTTFAAVIFAVLRQTSLSTEWCIVVVGHLAVAGVGQFLLGNRFSPRLVSSIGGMIYLPSAMMLYWAADQESWGFSSKRILVELVVLLLWGSVLGYLAGAILAGLFLVRDFWQHAKEATADFRCQLSQTHDVLKNPAVESNAVVAQDQRPMGTRAASAGMPVAEVDPPGPADGPPC